MKILLPVIVGTLLICTSLANACSTHGSAAAGALRSILTGNVDAQGRLEAFVGIEETLVPPDASTVCVTGIGLGSTVSQPPQGFDVVDAQIVIANTVTGITTPLPQFNFSANSNTSASFSAGSGLSDPATNPIIPAATWFGFSAPVEPFIAPTLGPNEVIELGFVVVVPTSALPLSIQAQFAAGEGVSGGTPLFTGQHPAQYFTASDNRLILVPEPSGLLLTLGGLLFSYCGAVVLHARSGC